MHSVRKAMLNMSKLLPLPVAMTSARQMRGYPHPLAALRTEGWQTIALIKISNPWRTGHVTEGGGTGPACCMDARLLAVLRWWPLPLPLAWAWPRRRLGTVDVRKLKMAPAASRRRSPWSTRAREYHSRKKRPYGVSQEPPQPQKKPVSCSVSSGLGTPAHLSKCSLTKQCQFANCFANAGNCALLLCDTLQQSVLRWLVSTATVGVQCTTLFLKNMRAPVKERRQTSGLLLYSPESCGPA